jgi:excisionase family DNA binding protein
MTLNEAAAVLGLEPDTLRKQAQRGVLRAERRGRDWHVTPEEVERYRREHKR